MRFIVLSDTHIPDFAKRLPPSIRPHLRRADAILHAGDVTAAYILDELAQHAPVRATLGNNDGDDVRAWGATEEVRLQAEGARIAMVHDAGSKAARTGRLRRRYPDADVIVFGHSHIPVSEEHEGIHLLNPGSPTWKRRQPEPTVGLIEVAEGRVRTRVLPLTV